MGLVQVLEPPRTPLHIQTQILVHANFWNLLFFQQSNINKKVYNKVIQHISIEIKLNSLPNDKFLDWFKLKAFAEDKKNVT